MWGFTTCCSRATTCTIPLVKVPLIIKYPGQDERRRTSEALVNNVDVAPTLLHCVGCDSPPSMVGLDLRANPEGRDVVFAEARGGAAYVARTAAHKLFLCRDDAHSQFLDLERDPLEVDEPHWTTRLCGAHRSPSCCTAALGAV